MLALHRFCHDESGENLIEYVLLAMMIAFGAVMTMKGLASEVNVAYSSVDSRLSSVIAGDGDSGNGGGGGHGHGHGHGGRGGGDGGGGGGGDGGGGGQGEGHGG